MVRYIVASDDDMEMLMQSRLEMLKEINDLTMDYMFDDEFIAKSREYFKSKVQMTILAVDEEVVGCATMCYIEMMPTFSHPTGKRAHLMNVYTRSQYRRQGIASQMLSMLIKDAAERGVTEISLDTTIIGKTLYKKFGFTESAECMVLTL